MYWRSARAQGYVSMVLADRVGPEGLVYAVDRSADAFDPAWVRLQRETCGFSKYLS